jgi:hypothetical protein
MSFSGLFRRGSQLEGVGVGEFLGSHPVRLRGQSGRGPKASSGTRRDKREAHETAKPFPHEMHRLETNRLGDFCHFLIKS